MVINIVVTFEFEGFHRWPGAPEGHYLKNLHRHIFHVTAWKSVEHGDRQIEFVNFKRVLLDGMVERYGGAVGSEASCEHMAAYALDRFVLSRCRVMEDGENGAEVTRR